MYGFVRSFMILYGHVKSSVGNIGKIGNKGKIRNIGKGGNIGDIGNEFCLRK